MPETSTATISEMNEFVKTVVEELRDVATTKTVIGEPMEIGGRTLIPVISIMVGFGAGGGSGTGDMPTTERMKTTGMGQGLGVGGGGGARVEPIAFIVIDKDKVEILPTKSAAGAINKIIDEAPELMDKAMEMGQKYMDRQKEQQDKPKESK
jgi:uncharacterized spore protein YtfJ